MALLNRHERPPQIPAYKAGNLPLYSLVTTVLLIASGIIGAVVLHSEKSLVLLVGLVVTTVPSVIAAAFAERASRDIRNGVITEKSMEGTVKALEVTGVTETVDKSLRGESTAAALTALTELLQQRRERDTLDDLLLEHFKKQDREKE